MVHFWKCYIKLKALLCNSNINGVLQVGFKLQGCVAREAIHFFVHIPKVIIIRHIYLYHHNLRIL